MRSAFMRAVLSLMMLMSCAALQAAQRLDDSASPRSRVAAQLVMTNEGRLLEDSLNPSTAVIRFGPVDYKLATRRYIGRQSRIYYVVPGFINGLLSADAMRVDWKTRGQFASGTAHPGGRQLVWSGTVLEPWMSEIFDLSIEVSLREIQLPGDGLFGFESYFEIETSP